MGCESCESCGCESFRNVFLSIENYLNRDEKL